MEPEREMTLEEACIHEEEGREKNTDREEVEQRISLGEGCILPVPYSTQAWDPDDCTCVYGMQALQGLCFLVILLFHVSMDMSHGKGNNVKGLVQMMESMTMDFTTLLFVVTGCVDSYLHNSVEITWGHALNNIYHVNCLLYPHVLLTTIPFMIVGMSIQGLWNRGMTWVINLGSAIYLPPFLEYDQTSSFQLINQPVSILMTLVLCRCLHPLARKAIEDAMHVMPNHHEIVNIGISFFQTTASCVFTSLHMRDNHLYFSYRFLLPRLSEYTLGCVVYTYLISSKYRSPHHLLEKIERSLHRYWELVVMVHFFIWVSVVSAPQPSDTEVCRRISQDAPCMDILDSFVSRGVLLAIMLIGYCKRRKRIGSFMMWMCDHLVTLQLQMIYQYPVTVALTFFMGMVHLEMIATVYVLISLLLGLILSHSVNKVLTHRCIVVLDKVIGMAEGRLTRGA